MQNGDIVKRNGNYFKVKRTADGHYYTALIWGSARVTAWHRTTLQKLLNEYERIENYKPVSIDMSI